MTRYDYPPCGRRDILTIEGRKAKRGDMTSIILAMDRDGIMRRLMDKGQLIGTALKEMEMQLETTW